jgi:hypothetical protein
MEPNKNDFYVQKELHSVLRRQIAVWQMHIRSCLGRQVGLNISNFSFPAIVSQTFVAVIKCVRETT